MLLFSIDVHASTVPAPAVDRTPARHGEGMANQQKHRVTIRLVYVNDGRTPWKWRGTCTCGWVCLSWQWIAVDRPGGTLPMTLEHVGLLRDAALYKVVGTR